MNDLSCLTGQFLIAMPSMMDPNFHQTVTYICEHNDRGALGIVVNRPMDMELGDVFSQLEMEGTGENLAHLPVLRGGPVQMERGFVLHESPDNWDSTVEVEPSIYVTTSQDILSAMAAGKGPERAVVALGYAGWGAGQLEDEISANAWLSVPAVADIIFDTPFADRWRQSAGLLGVDVATLSGAAGHA
jgi:putative transcriptional regulator